MGKRQKAFIKNNIHDEINNKIISNAKKIIIKKGFDNITLNELLNEISISPAIFYKRFNNLENLFDIIVREYDYWLTDILKKNSKMKILPTAYVIL